VNESHLELKLLTGKPLEIEGAGNLYIPSLHEIIDIGESQYNLYLSALLFNKANLDGLETDELENFDLWFAICYRDADFRKICYAALKFFFKADAHMGSDDEGVFIYFNDRSQRIDKQNYDEIQSIIRKANYIKTQSEPEFAAANSKAQEMINLILRNKKNKPKTADTMNLHSMISGLAWKNNGMTMPQILELTIYQLYNGFFVTENIDHYQHTFAGIYAGTVDSKEINVSKIHWARIL